MRYKRTLPNFYQLITILNDLQYHSGEAIALSLTVTRNAVWKMVKFLEQHNIVLEKQRSQGYRLMQPLFLLERKKILEALPKKLRDEIGLEIYAQLPSTNSYFHDNNDRDYSKPIFCLAELQTAGKGRMGRRWHSPFAKNIYCSLRWDVPVDVSKLAGISLVVGISVVQALENFDSSLPLALKWPNDILANGKKLAGILIEVLAEAHGSCSMIIGIGLNANMLLDDTTIDQPWTSLQQLTGKNIDRNHLLAILIPILLENLQQFIATGFHSFKALWKKYDALVGKTITLTHHDKKIRGTVVGVDQFGQLRLQKADKTTINCAAGEATLR